MPEEMRPVPGRVAVGEADIVGTGMSSPLSSPLSSSSRSSWVTISLFEPFSSLALLTELLSFGAIWRSRGCLSSPGHFKQTLFRLPDLVPQGSPAVSLCLDQTLVCAICAWRLPGILV